MVELWWIIVAAILLLAFLVWVWFPIRAGFRGARLTEARRDFHRQRERLEVKFVQLGMSSNRHDAPRWIDCEFEDDVVYARNRTTGELNAFVAVTIEMEEGAGGLWKQQMPWATFGRRRLSFVSNASDGRRTGGRFSI